MTGLRTTFVTRLDRELTRRKISRKDFAAMLGVTPPHVTRLFKGSAEPTLATVERIASTLDIKPYLLLKPPNPKR